METNLEENIIKLQPYHDDIILTEYSHWSKKLKKHVLCKPVFSQEISPEQLRYILLLNPTYRRFLGERIDSKRPAFFNIPTQSIDCFPKLGVMSWKEVLGMTLWSKNISSEIPLRMLFGSITIRMVSILHAWIEENRSIHFYLYPYKDLNNSVELRFFVSKNEVRFIEKTVIGNIDSIEMNNVLELVHEIKNEIVLDQAFVDIIITHGNMKLLEINPVIGRIYGR